MISLPHGLRMLLQLAGLTRNTLTLQAALTRCRRRGLEVSSVIDIGASNGSWSIMARKRFPRAFFFLVEAQMLHEPALKKLKTVYAGIFDYVICAAGDRNGEIYFDASDPFGGAASHSRLDNNYRPVPVRTIDSLVEERGLKPPFLLKLDTHGFEMPIFEGARETLRRTELIVVETYNFKLTPKTLRFHEICSWLEERGFRCIDLCEPLHRPGDEAFWQMDLFFLPAANKVFASNNYR
jgi:FkbM family methyltransferase